MGSLLEHEAAVDEAIAKVIAKLKEDASLGRSSNFSFHARYVKIHADWSMFFYNLIKTNRRYVHENTVELLFGSQPGMRLPQETSRLLEAGRSSAVPFCLIALFPYIMLPLMEIPFLKFLIIPRSEDEHGFGQIMAVSVFYSKCTVRRLNSAHSVAIISCVFRRSTPSLLSTLGDSLRSPVLQKIY